VCVGIGWRVQSEILPLQWSQVDQRSQTLPLEPGQTRNAEGRSLPYALLPELADSSRSTHRISRLMTKSRRCSRVKSRAMEAASALPKYVIVSVL
jgi:hypothetical protein